MTNIKDIIEPLGFEKKGFDTENPIGEDIYSFVDGEFSYTLYICKDATKLSIKRKNNESYSSMNFSTKDLSYDYLKFMMNYLRKIEE